MLSDVVGHGRLIELLSRSIQKGSLPPSLLFSGPSGVGKRLTATAVAQALNCLSGGDSRQARGDACGTCSACRRIARGIHPDVIVVEPGESGAIKIDAVRDGLDPA